MDLTWPDGSGPDLIVDDGGDATLMIHLGVDADRDPSVLDKPCDSKEARVLMDRIILGHKTNPGHWTTLPGTATWARAAPIPCAASAPVCS